MTSTEEYLWHCYKYVVKAVHTNFFPLFALRENPGAPPGSRVVAKRKLLYLEKIFASLLLGSSRMKQQLVNRILEVEQTVQDASSGPDILRQRRVLLKMLKALQVLLQFFLPAVFRIGYKVRCCTWEGRAADSGILAREIMEQCFFASRAHPR